MTPYAEFTAYERQDPSEYPSTVVYGGLKIRGQERR